ncbi:MAG TPA: DNA polymerase, partial [Candidatus Saccharimonadales bacterium]|nr:DNA polymerase [Candidatus Saccharimonadales bacterium]
GPECHVHGIPGRGNMASGVMLLGIAPAREEMRTGKPMTGQSGKLTDNLLAACGWARHKTYATNLICRECREPTFEQIMYCRPRLQEEVALMKPKLIVLLGETVGELFFPNKKYGAVRGSIDWYAPWNCHVLPTYHPASILYSSHSGRSAVSELVTRSIVRDFCKIARFFDTPPNPLVTFDLIFDLAKAQSILDNWALTQPEFVSLDVETFLDKESDDTVAVENTVAMFSMSDNSSTYWMPGELLKQLAFPKLNYTFHNGMFDTLALQEATDGGQLLDIVHDTMYMSYALDERGAIHKLKQLSREECASGFYEDHPSLKKWNDKLRDSEWARVYNAKDTAYTARVAGRLLPRVDSEGMRPLYDMLIKAANIYRHMQATGIPMDTSRIHTLLKEYVPLRDEKEADLRNIIEEYGGDPNINLSSPKQLGEFLYGKLRLPGGPSTAAPIIEALADEHPFIDKLLDKRHLDKAIDTYIVGAWDDIKKSGRIHPSPLLHGQVTGRVSYSPYAVNTLPRETAINPYLSRIRWLFTAPEDYVVLLIDYSQAEIWNAWFYSQDPQMLHDLRTGDFHTATGAFIHNIPLESVRSEQRSDAKRTTFGQFFGIGADKLAKQIKKTRIEASAFQRAWHARYPGYSRYVNDTIKEARATGELVTVSQRKRRFPIVDESMYNQIINYKIQATSHDALLSSIIEGYWMVRDMGGYPNIDIHDAWAMLAPKNNYKEIAARVIEIMQKSRFPGMPGIPAEAKVGPSLGEVEKFKL